MDIKESQERIDERTPNGGDYAIVYYMDKDGNPCKSEQAEKCEIVEYKNDGTFVMSTLGYCR